MLVNKICAYRNIIRINRRHDITKILLKLALDTNQSSLS